MKTNIKLKVTPEQSEAVQKICFANGAEWLTFNSTVSFTDKEYLFINPNRIWCRGITNHNKGSIYFLILGMHLKLDLYQTRK